MRVRTYDPFRQFDRLFAAPATIPPAVPLDVVRSQDDITLYFDLPGVDVDSIDLTVEKRELVLRAERPSLDLEDAELVRRERRHGTVERRLLLAENLDTAALRADYLDGVLVVTIPVIPEAKPRKIEISATPAELSA